MNWEAVAASAAREGFPVATQQDLVDALFRPGLSTKQGATEVSGRGVGLAALKERVHELGGTVRVQSLRGRGTSFRCNFVLAGTGPQFGIMISASGQPASRESTG